MGKNKDDRKNEEIKTIDQDTLSELFRSTSRKVIIKNPNALNPDADFIPKELKYRQNQVIELARYFTEIINGLTPGHVVIRGRTGTGKTLTIKFVLNGFLQHTNKDNLHIGIAYASAHKVGTGERASLSPHRYIAELMKSMGYEINARKRGGIGWAGMMDLFRDYINEQDYSHVIIVCDDIHRLKSVPFIMHFARPNEVWGLNHNKLTVFFVTDESQFVKNIPREALYSFENLNLYFPPYNAMELYGILKQRVEYALHTPDVIDDDILHLTAAKVAKREGDARYVIRVLQSLIRDYVAMPEEKITEEKIDMAFINIDQDDYTRAVSALTTHGKMIIITLMTKHKFDVVETSKLYREYSTLVKDDLGLDPISSRRFYDYISYLEKEDIITWYVKSKGRGKGKKSEVQLKVDMLAVEGILKALRKEEDVSHAVKWDDLEEILEKNYHFMFK